MNVCDRKKSGRWHILLNTIPKAFSHLNFVMVSSGKSHNTLTRAFRLRLKNIDEYAVYNLKATLIHASDQVTIEDGEVDIGRINQGNTAVSEDTFSYSIDTSKTRLIPEVKLHWKVEYDVNGKHKVDEALVTEIVRNK